MSNEGAWTDEPKWECDVCGLAGTTGLYVLSGSFRHIDKMACIQTLRAELDALREQLAAREWRSVTEPPTEYGTNIEAVILCEYYPEFERAWWNYVEGRWTSGIQKWRPAPPDSEEDAARKGHDDSRNRF